MLDPVLIDTGPLVACFNPGDRDHDRCLDKFKNLKGRRLVTTQAVVTEVLFLLDFSHANQQKFLQFLASGSVEVLEFTMDDFPGLADLMQKYKDLPMDYADATLVALANRLETRAVFTLDERDFDIYRTARHKTFEKI